MSHQSANMYKVQLLQPEKHLNRAVTQQFRYMSATFDF